MTRDEFLRREACACRRFMDRHAMEDFLMAPGSVAYSRAYRCDCGFRSHDPTVIFDHAQSH